MNPNKYSLLRICIGGIIICFSLTVMAHGGTREVSCNWIAGPVQINGILDEWKNMPTTFFEGERLVLGVGNDSTHMYLFFRTDDPALIRTIRRSGIRLWLDPRGKKKKDLSFHYRGGPTNEEMEEAGLIDPNRPDDRELDERMQNMMSRLEEMQNKITVTDKDLELEEIIPSDGTYGPKVQHAFDHGFCVFEVSIPLPEHNIDYYGANATPGQKIGIGIKWGGPPEKGMMGMGWSGDGMGGGTGSLGGDRGGIGGRAGMGGSRGRMGSRVRPAEKKEFWVKTQLTDMDSEEK